MPLQLDHTIVPAYDKVKSAEFIARMFGLKYEGPWGHFAPVKVNEILTLDFDDSDNPRANHYAFLASDEEFDAILQRINDEGVVFGSGPRSRTDGEINHLHQGRGFYFECENGHVWEVITHTSSLRISLPPWAGCRGWAVRPYYLGAFAVELPSKTT